MCIRYTISAWFMPSACPDSNRAGDRIRLAASTIRTCGKATIQLATGSGGWGRIVARRDHSRRSWVVDSNHEAFRNVSGRTPCACPCKAVLGQRDERSRCLAATNCPEGHGRLGASSSESVQSRGFEPRTSSYPVPPARLWTEHAPHGARSAVGAIQGYLDAPCPGLMGSEARSSSVDEWGTGRRPYALD